MERKKWCRYSKKWIKIQLWETITSRPQWPAATNNGRLLLSTGTLRNKGANKNRCCKEKPQLLTRGQITCMLSEKRTLSHTTTKPRGKTRLYFLRGEGEALCTAVCRKFYILFQFHKKIMQYNDIQTSKWCLRVALYFSLYKIYYTINLAFWTHIIY